MNLIAKILLGFVTLIFGVNTNSVESMTPIATIKPTLIVEPVKKELVAPVAEFRSRITKKFFGTYITPQNSPVKPEKFTGYHTGVDVEYEDGLSVVVSSVANGTVVVSKYASGYGGVVVIKHKDFYSIYGHLQPTTMIKNNVNVEKGEQIGILGKGFSSETDGERKHLHFGMAKINSIKGYVQSKSELKNWIDPLTFNF